MNTEILIETLAAIKNTTGDKIKNLETWCGQFQIGNCRYSYELTPSGKMVKTV